MLCTNCGRAYPDGAKYCPRCGAPILPAAGTKNVLDKGVAGNDVIDQTALRRIMLQSMDYRDLKEHVDGLYADHRRIVIRICKMIIVSVLVCFITSLLLTSSGTAYDSGSLAAAATLAVVITWGCFGVFGWVFDHGWTIIASWIFIIVLLAFELILALFIGIPYFIYYLVRLVTTTSRLRDAEERLSAARAALGE